jgi:hypothetical protein
MDYLAYLLALKDLAECPIVDSTLLGMFGGKGTKEMSISAARRHYRKKGR